MIASQRKGRKGTATISKHYDQSWAHPVNENIGRRAGQQRTAVIDAILSCLAACTHRGGDCGNFPESQSCTSFVSSLLPSRLFTPHTCIIKSSSCAIKRPLVCADSKKQAWKRESDEDSAKVLLLSHTLNIGKSLVKNKELLDLICCCLYCNLQISSVTWNTLFSNVWFWFFYV